MSLKVSLLPLGCARNLVDSEVILGILKMSGAKIVDITSEADLAIVNTCSFIEDAKKESISAILDLIALKNRGRIKKILVAGCLPQRYGRVLKDEFKEIDGFIGVDAFDRLPLIIKSLAGDKKRIVSISSNPEFLYDDKSPRVRLSPKHYAYLKISEGCSHKCSFCVIPRIRGRHRSRQIESILKEAEALAKNGVKEINIIGQDTTLYGMDLYRRPSLAELLRKLAKLQGTPQGVDPRLRLEASAGARWIRLLYTHPAHFTDELIRVIKDEPSICKYVDLPIQHISDGILKRMNRGTTKKSILELLHKIRRDIPSVAIRTSLIVGFSGETKKDFFELLDFVKEEKFERLGAFTYSREEGTAAYKFSGQISEKEKNARWDEIMKAQQDVSRENNRALIGKELDVIIDEKDASDPNLYLGRSYMDAPEVDGIVYVKTSPLPPPQRWRAGKGERGPVRRSISTTNFFSGEGGRMRGQVVKTGDFARVKIIDAYEYDLVGDVL